MKFSAPEMYMLDTNVFNRILDNKLSLTHISLTGVFVASHVQLDELKATKSEGRREDLLSVFKAVDPEVAYTESSCFDISHFDESNWSNGKLFTRLKEAMDALQPKASNSQDCLIAETAIVKGFILVTGDKNLAKVATAHGARVMLIP